LSAALAVRPGGVSRAGDHFLTTGAASGFGAISSLLLKLKTSSRTSGSIRALRIRALRTQFLVSVLALFKEFFA
jgi:hypothetical protein